MSEQPGRRTETVRLREMRRIIMATASVVFVFLGIGGQCNTNPPLAPIRPLGPDTTWVGDVTHFRATAYSPDARPMRLLFDWGDSSRFDTTAYFRSWDTVSVLRVWWEAGNFEVRAKAIDDRNVGSLGWSVSHAVFVHPPHTER